MRICAAALLAVLAIAAADAAASVDKVTIAVPANVTPRTVYDVTLKGFSRKRAIAYLFIDYARCAGTFAAEHRRPHETPEYYSVRGTFAEVSGWKSSSSGSDHACAYLISRASGTMLATAHVSFMIH